MHIHVEGLGPAGTAFALRALARGHHVTATEPKWPRLTWPATYGVIETDVPAWADEWFRPPHEVTVRTTPGLSITGPTPAEHVSTGRTTTQPIGAQHIEARRIEAQHIEAQRIEAQHTDKQGAFTERTLPYRYRMMDNPRMLSALREAAAAGQLIIHSNAPTLTSGAQPEAIVAAHGAAHTDVALWQIAVGYVYQHSAEPGTPPSAPQPRFMDWTQPATNADFPPSFVYIQPVDDGILIEETVLTTHRKPTELLAALRNRLDNRLTDPELHTFVESSPRVRIEEVAIPMATRARAWYRPRKTPLGRIQSHRRSHRESAHKNTPITIYFGARGGLIHPATGYSVGASLQAVDQVLDQLEGKTARSSLVAQRLHAELAFVLRQIGGELIARADQYVLADFFDCFFKMPQTTQLAYLTGHNGVEVMKAMWSLRKETGLRHPFLQPLWKNPRSVYRAVKQRMAHAEDN
ncbi:lycopene cyclase family protein [Corynebacterium auriscanis]|uniref:lycopene cyclase family protein n=1 Tax=Corynebacterium auriscanis TaxID=99807 RepID=UPI0025B58503|nr:lycopene cyclase family protein [Corynebacterium auriscanis]